MVIVFAECGLLIGFFLPGDTLLFTAGVLVQRDTFHQPLWLVIAAHLRGRDRREPGRLRDRPARRPRGVQAARLAVLPAGVRRTHGPFFEKYGPPAIVLGRFVPVVRTVITVMAGAGRMDYRTYTVYTVLGGVLWATSVTLLGYFLGNVDFIANNVELLLLAGVAVSVVPIAAQLLRRQKRP